jgi:transcriptional regulator with XRE-family HTH domain
MTTFSERLLHAARHAGVGPTQTEIATSLGVSRQTVNHWFTKAGEPQSEILERIEERWGVSRKWLRTGDGDMLPKLNSSEPLPDDELKLLRDYRSAPAENRPKIRAIVRTLRKAVVTIAVVIPPLLAPDHADAKTLHKSNCEPSASVIRIALRRLREWLRGANPLVLSRAGFGL